MVHVIEDDATFSESIQSAIQLCSRLMLTNPAFQRVDLIFLDHFLDRQLCAAGSAAMPATDPGSVRFLKASKTWCTDRLAELHGVETPIPRPNDTKAFLHFFETLQAQMVSF